jgi:hypothetical protein
MLGRLNSLASSENMLMRSDPQTETTSSTREQLERWNQWALAQAERIDPSLEDRYLAAIMDE